MTPSQSHSRGHLAILASAGSGKTTRLTYRYIQLLADKNLKITPERICALTFTRKAAGEIFDRIVANLCRGAANGEQAGKMADQLAISGLNEHDFTRLLRLFLDHIHRAIVGTMDSFIVGVAKAFPIELGIPMNFQVADGGNTDGKASRQDILADILADPGAGNSGATEFLEAFKKATFGVEEKSLGDLLDNMVNAFHLSYRFCPDQTRWGNDRLIWPGKSRPGLWTRRPVELLKQAEIAAQWIKAGLQQEKGIDQRLLNKLASVIQALTLYGPATPWDDEFKGALFEQLLENRDALRRGDAALVYYKKPAHIAPDAARALACLIDNLFAVEINRSLKKTTGLHNLLELYDRAYERVSRASGRFSFSDIQYMLALGDISRNVSTISCKRQEGRLFIDYRMNCRLDHWLLDEFQDTSDLQWAVFKNLVSELIQEAPAGDTRSFFYVGDVKQSIYRWRGGNPRLFLDILKQYNQGGQVIRLEKMSATHRCSPPVIEAVNKVFAKLPADYLPAGSIEAWQAVWTEHQTLNTKAPGHVALLEPLPTNENNEDQDGSRYQLVADLLNEIQPIKRQIGVGILTRDNKACGELVNVLRRECPGIGFVHEGKAGIIENELAQVLLALVRLAAHPGDEFAWQHVRMSPLTKALEQQKITRSNIALRLLSELESRGFQAFIGSWGTRLHGVCALNDYGRQCLARLEKAAAEFDVSGSRSCNRFLQFIGDYQIHEEAARSAVRIMTIHQAKGLEFDMVILPQLQHRQRMNMVKTESADLLYAGNPFEPAWILRAPKRVIMEHDQALNAQLQKADEAHCSDWLCLLYVAMTRARHALYMIASRVNNSATFRPASLLKLQLTGQAEPEAEPNITINNKSYVRLYPPSPGNAKWYESFQERPAQAKADRSAAPGPGDFYKRASRRKVFPRSEPSKQDSFERKASDLFKPVTKDVLDFGSAIHGLFEKIAWLDAQTDGEAIIRSWRPSQPCDQKVCADVLIQFRKCLQSSEVRGALARPAGVVELWREKSFEIIMDGQWISGIFDRVVIGKDAAGKPVEAVILDYKSNQDLDSEASMRHKAQQYLPQMELYRRALAGILGLAADRISLDLLFTVPARIYRQSAGQCPGKNAIFFA